MVLFDHNGWYAIKPDENKSYTYSPTSPHGQDMTQCQFLTGF